MQAKQGISRLWAPWRMPYIHAETRKSERARGKSSESCLFCRLRRTGNDRANLVLARREHGILVLNRFPYNPAHLMIATRRHAARFADLEMEERVDFLDLTALAEEALAIEYRPHGVNYGANVGRVSGAGFPGHLHLHLVPRWNGDTNFMPIIGETKVLPESLQRTWMRLRRAVQSLNDRTPRAKTPRPRKARRGEAR